MANNPLPCQVSTPPTAVATCHPHMALLPTHLHSYNEHAYYEATQLPGCLCMLLELACDYVLYYRMDPVGLIPDLMLYAHWAC